ncbi:MAG: DUF3179 domain-containing (seleno)protein [Phycisphaeraceae bacterium]
MTDHATEQPQWKFGRKGTAPLRPEGRRTLIALAAFLGVAFVLAIAGAIYEGWQLRQTALGDGRTVESYGYDLSNLNVNRETLVSARMLRDEQIVLHEPDVLTLAEVDSLSDHPLWPVVHDDEQVIGVVVDGEARAYPIQIMRGHEIVNDVVGGRPIAVTYSPIADSVAVFDRAVEVDGESTALRFGYSGLLSNSNLVMYNIVENSEDEGATEDLTQVSLWSQLRMRAIAGPLAGDSADEAAELTLVPTWIGRWADWREMQPRTTVLEAVREQRRAYVSEPWTRYYAAGELQFPVDRQPGTDDDRGPMDPVIIQQTADGWQVQDGGNQDRTADDLKPTLRTRWFAWYAIQNDE